MQQVANFDYINDEDAAAAAAEEAEREARAKLEAEMEGQGRAQFWDSLLKDRVVEQQVEEFEELGKGKRSRRQVVYPSSILVYNLRRPIMSHSFPKLFSNL